MPTNGISLVVHFTSSARSAGAGIARVGPLDALAGLALANVAGVAVVVDDALGAAASYCVWLGNQARLAFANCIVVGSHPAN